MSRPAFLQNPKVMLALPVIALGVLLLMWNFSSAPIETGKVEGSQPVLGKFLVANIRIFPGPEMRVPATQALDQAFIAMREVGDLMNRFDPESDISKINAAKAGQSVAVDPRTWYVLLKAMAFHRLSHGAFDVTVPPVLALYDYQSRKMDALPEADVIHDAKKSVGSQMLHFEREGMLVSKEIDSLQIDLGAIAKGYAVDAGKDALIRAGVKNAMIEVGGELWLLGHVPEYPKADQLIGTSTSANSSVKKEDATSTTKTTDSTNAAAASGQKNDAQEKERAWTTGIQNPRGDGWLQILDLREGDRAIATSGDYEKFFMIGGDRYSHIVDPRSGLPVTHGLISVTIMSPRSCLEADALATAVSVLGADEGKKLLNLFPNLHAIYTHEDENGELVTESYSSPNDIVLPEQSSGTDMPKATTAASASKTELK